MIARPLQLLLSIALATCAGCRGAAPAPAPTDEGSGEVQAIIELDGAGGMPFLAERGVIASIYPNGGAGELVIHAASDLDDRQVLAMVFDLGDPALPGAIDLARHTVVWMELDRSGTAELVLDGVPDGAGELLGALEPGGEIVGTFNLLLPGRDEMGAPLTARIDGTFSVVASPAAAAVAPL